MTRFVSGVFVSCALAWLNAWPSLAHGQYGVCYPPTVYMSTPVVTYCAPAPYVATYPICASPTNVTYQSPPAYSLTQPSHTSGYAHAAYSSLATHYYHAQRPSLLVPPTQPLRQHYHSSYSRRPSPLDWLTPPTYAHSPDTKQPGQFPSPANNNSGVAGLSAPPGSNGVLGGNATPPVQAPPQSGGNQTSVPTIKEEPTSTTPATAAPTPSNSESPAPATPPDQSSIERALQAQPQSQRRLPRVYHGYEPGSTAPRGPEPTRVTPADPSETVPPTDRQTHSILPPIRPLVPVIRPAHFAQRVAHSD